MEQESDFSDTEIEDMRTKIRKQMLKAELIQEEKRKKLQEHRNRAEVSLKQELRSLTINPSPEEHIHLKYNPIKLYKLYVKNFTDIPKSFAIAPILSLLGFCLSLKPVQYFNHGTLFHNIFTLLLGRTWLTRKSTAVRKVLKPIDNESLIPKNFPIPESTEAISDALESTRLFQIFAKSMGLFCIDEMGWWLSDMKGKKHMTGMMDRVCKLYDCDSWARTTKTHGIEIVDNPYVSIITATTPKRFLQLTNQFDIASGFLPRFLIFFEEREKNFIPKPSSYNLEIIDNGQPNYPQSEDEIMTALNKIFNTLILSTILYPKNNIFIEFESEKALPYFQEFEKRFTKRIMFLQEKYDDDPIIDFIGRYSSQYVVKIADILSIADNLEKFVKNLTNVIFAPETYKKVNVYEVELKYLLEAIDIVNHSLDSLEKLLIPNIRNVKEDEFPEMYKRILNYLYKHRNDEERLKTSQINRGLNGINAKQLDEMLDTLERLEYIEIYKKSKIRKKEIQFWRITKDGKEKIYHSLNKIDQRLLRRVS